MDVHIPTPIPTPTPTPTPTGKRNHKTLSLIFLSCLLPFLGSGTGTSFRIRFRFQRPKMNTVPTGFGSATLLLMHYVAFLNLFVPLFLYFPPKWHWPIFTPIYTTASPLIHPYLLLTHTFAVIIPIPLYILFQPCSWLTLTTFLFLYHALMSC